MPHRAIEKFVLPENKMRGARRTRKTAQQPLQHKTQQYLLRTNVMYLSIEYVLRHY